MKNIFLFSTIICLLSFSGCNNKDLPPIENEEAAENFLCDQSVWHLSSVPNRFTESSLSNNIKYGYNRAKLAWYNINANVFLRNSTMTPQHIKDDREQRMHPLVREVYEQEIYPSRQIAYGEPTVIPCLNIAYYPNERGPYNFDVDGVNYDGTLTNPSSRWAGMITEIPKEESCDTIIFWMMSPFTSNNNQSISGSIFFDIGSISKDILKDGYISYENGLSEVGQLSVWGVLSSFSGDSIFDSDDEKRLSQDVGLDGLCSDTIRGVNDEAIFFSSFLERLKDKVNVEAYRKVEKDPSSDDFHYYRDTYYDQIELPILERYKNINNPERNSLPPSFSHENYVVTLHNKPDSENFNYSSIISMESDYDEYEIKISSELFEIGQNYISDIRESDVNQLIKWYQFKIPLAKNEQLSHMNEINLRMYLTGFENPVVFRIAEFTIK
ncbi:T9SS outer membrane translocon Sov/SprA [Carboxylicivirga linearis]|uniref:Cell surface protein SprA n=1 Tax=Carboxylicivirga linearis TaxID=1628157 RepID=A0ABS5JPB2_9BACT|nr:cell surface protein SprA [Carboxylicivirga linearis]MBS2096748.1 cell surface protein SprA [Carboxylicivirga linearis]